MHDAAIVHVDAEPDPEVDRRLSDLGAAVERAKTLTNCLDELPSADCVVCALPLPDADGVDAIEAIRARSDVPIVVYAAAGSESLAGETIAAGADGYVPAREGVDVLADRVQNLLADDAGVATRGAAVDGSTAETEPIDRLELLLEQAPVAVIEWDLEMRAVGWNGAAVDLFGYTQEEAIGEHAMDLIVPDSERDELEPDLERLLADAENVRNVNRNVRKDGTIVTCEWVNTPLVDEDGDVVSVFSLAQDVTDEIKHAAALEALQGTTHDLMRADSIEEIGEITIGATESVIERPRASVRLYDDDENHLAPVTVSDGVKESIEPAAVGPGDGPLWEAFEAGESSVIDDANAEMVPYDLEFPMGNAVLHPLGDHGLLTVASPSETELEVADTHLVTVLAAAAEAALDRAARKRKIENLHEVASRLEDCDSECEIFERTVEAAEGVLNFDVCAADSVDGDYLVTEAVSEDIHPDSYARRLPIGGTIAGKTHRNGRTYRIGDLQNHEIATPQRDAYRSVLSVPIGDRGVFQAVSSERDAFDEHDEELAELLISHVSDALDRQAFESKLREERDRFATLFENVPDAVVSARLDAGAGPIVEEINPAFERVFGYDEDEIVDEPLDRFIVPSDRMAESETFNRRGNRGEIIESEVKRRTTDGLRDFMMRIVPIEEGEENDRTFGVYTDITEQKQRQKRVEILNRVLRHDLRNGMNIINGCAEMLETTLEGESGEEYALAIQERATELIGLAEKTRAVERTLDRGNAATGPVDVVQGVEEAVDRVAEASPEAEIDVSVPDRAFARADDLLRTAIYHVVENAVDHNDLSTPAVEIELEEVEDGETLAIRVADNGPGIPADERDLLQEDKEITQLRHTSGLGLWLVNWVVTQSGGRLAFEENDPRGTIVTLEVPRGDPASNRIVSDGAAAGD